jgi:DNA polymerase-3 subunit gamma/tau
MAENLFSKYRPSTLESMYGHSIIVKEFKKRFKENKIPHAILLTGITGVGKTTFIRIIAKAIACKQKDENGNGCNICDMCQIIDNEKLSNIYFELNASNIGIDQMREIEDSSNRKAIGKYTTKIFVIDEMQELNKNKSAEKNILKVLEKPSDRCFFILAAMDSRKINNAIKNRCVHYKLNPLSFQVISKCLGDICDKEGITIDNREKAETLVTIAQNCDGSLRTAISYLERCIYSDIWEARLLLKELDIISDTNISIIINCVLKGDMNALSLEINEDVLKKIKYFLMLLYKKLNGITLSGWQTGQIKDIVNVNWDNLENVIEGINELSKFPYLYTDLIEFHIMQIINKIKGRNSISLETTKPRRVSKNA